MQGFASRGRDRTDPMIRIKHLRWWIAGLLACASALSYLDRQSFPVAVLEIQKHIPVSDRQYSVLQMLFLLAYSVMYAGGGKIVDWLGTRRGYAILIMCWSAATGLHGMVSTVFGFGIARFLLGLGEGGGFPSSSKAISEWFPPEDRALAFGLVNTGSSVGAVVAPPLIAFIIQLLNWRWIFFLTGAWGVVWALVWWLFYRTPKEEAPIAAKLRIAWIDLLKYRQMWALISAKFLTDAVWFFFIFWLPKYLGDVRRLNIRQIGYYAWIPYALAGAGSFIGGWLSNTLIKRHLTVNLSRKICLGLSAAIMPMSLLIAKSPLSMALAIFSLALFGHQFWSTILQTLSVDLFPSAVVGSVAGLMGAMGSFGAVLFDLMAGSVLTYSHSYSVLLILAGLFHPLAFLLIVLLIPKIEPVAYHLPLGVIKQ
jgi:ACS family hexuronate transporter-like MFS transporter